MTAAQRRAAARRAHRRHEREREGTQLEEMASLTADLFDTAAHLDKAMALLRAVLVAVSVIPPAERDLTPAGNLVAAERRSGFRVVRNG